MRDRGSEAALVCRMAGAEQQWLDLKGIMEQALKPQRFAHSLAVADASVVMGRIFGGDLVKLALAGLLHDNAKDLGDDALLALGEAHGLITDPAEREKPSLLHGPVGARRACQEWGIDDPAILEAICFHTTGAEGMGKEACIVFMADLIEPGRAYDGVAILRRLCREDLRAAMIEAIEQTLYIYLARAACRHGGSYRCLAWLKREGHIF